MRLICKCGLYAGVYGILFLYGIYKTLKSVRESLNSRMLFIMKKKKTFQAHKQGKLLIWARIHF